MPGSRWPSTLLVVIAVWAVTARAATGDVPVSLASDLTAARVEENVALRLVRVRGTVSGLGEGIVSAATPHPARRGFCVEDRSGGVWIATKPAIRRGLLVDDRELLRSVRYESEVEVVGILDEGGHQPVILPTRITVLGRGRLEPASEVRLSSFLSGGDEMRRVTVRGVVQEVTEESTRDNRWVLRIETGIGHFFVRVLKEDRYRPRELLDAKLQVTGLVTCSRNWRSEFVCPRLIVRRHEDIRILKPAPADPYSVEAVSLAGLNGYAPSGLPVHRRRVEGTVTYNDRSSLLYIQDGATGVRVHTSEPSGVSVGERVEVSGFIDTSRYLAGLRGAVVRPLPSQRPAPPVAVSLATTEFAEHQQRVLLGLRTVVPSMSVEGRLIRLSGEVLNFRAATNHSPNLLEIKWGDAITTALVAGPIDPLLPGTRVMVTGIARVSSDADQGSVEYSGPSRVDLLLRDASDIAVLEQPSWWTRQRVFVALGVVLAAGLAACAWAFFLKRMLDVRTEQLAMEVRNRRDAAIEFQAAMRERTRLAVDLHDTVLQTMAGIAFQIDACRTGREQAPRQLQGHLETAGRMARSGQEDLRNVVWALRCLPLEDGTLIDSIRAIARRVSQRYRIEMQVESDGDLPPLADFVAGNLLLVIQEASHNAVMHAEADHIHVALRMNSAADRLTVSVRDNGVGFDVATGPAFRDGHFGIEGMKQRIQRVGGDLVISSQRMVGTEVRAEIPIRVFDVAIA